MVSTIIVNAREGQLQVWGSSTPGGRGSEVIEPDFEREDVIQFLLCALERALVVAHLSSGP